MIVGCQHGQGPTLYIRDVPEEIVRTLKERAHAGGMSVSAYVVAELTRVASRPTNAQIAARLRELDRAEGPRTDDIVEALRVHPQSRRGEGPPDARRQ